MYPSHLVLITGRSEQETRSSVFQSPEIQILRRYIRLTMLRTILLQEGRLQVTIAADLNTLLVARKIYGKE